MYCNQNIGLVSGGINEGTKHIAILMFVTRGMQAINLRSYAINRLAIVMLIICSPALLFGTYLAYSIPSKIISVIVGCIFLIILSYNIINKGSGPPRETLKIGNDSSMFGGDRQHLYALSFASLASGSLMGICGTPGILIFYMLIYIPHQVYSSARIFFKVFPNNHLSVAHFFFFFKLTVVCVRYSYIYL